MKAALLKQPTKSNFSAFCKLFLRLIRFKLKPELAFPLRLIKSREVWLVTAAKLL